MAELNKGLAEYGLKRPARSQSFYGKSPWGKSPFHVAGSADWGLCAEFLKDRNDPDLGDFLSFAQEVKTRAASAWLSRSYVGQSGDTDRRFKDHENKTKKNEKGVDAVVTPVEGGKEARERAEQERIDQLGGTRDKSGSNTSNVRNPIGPARRIPPELAKKE